MYLGEIGTTCPRCGRDEHCGSCAEHKLALALESLEQWESNYAQRVRQMQLLNLAWIAAMIVLLALALCLQASI